MRRLALLVAGGALWLVLAAIPALADGGPHQLAVNNGTQGLAGDCAACHRAHTAQAASLLKTDMPGLCLACHNGTGATTDVVDGYQYVPGSGNTQVLGALRGGGFVHSSIDTSSPARLSYQSSHGTSFVAHISPLTNTAGTQLASATTTSTHGGVAGSTSWGSGTVWGNGAQGSGTTGATGVVLDCASCHNPHGNGEYRILQTSPGGDFGTTGGFAVTNSAGVAVTDVGDASTTKNYTILPGAQATDVITAGYTATTGDYWRRTYDPTGTQPWYTLTGTGPYTTLSSDPMNSGWNPSTDPVPTNAKGAMTAWCVQCHTRYNGYSTAGTTSLVAATPVDDTFMYKHGTTRVGCEQCHVSHGSNAVMTGPATGIENPGQTGSVSSTDSRLLKVDNLGTCQLCHDPTGTYPLSTYIGPTPTPLP